MKQKFVSFSAVLFLFSLTGCLTGTPRVQSIKSIHMNKTYTNIALYPFISTRYFGQSPAIPRPLYSKEPAALEKAMVSDNKIIVNPPVDSVFTITQESKIFNGLLLADMMQLGYSLRDGMYEISGQDTPQAVKSSYYISLDMLKEMREKYGLEGIIVGDIILGNDATNNTIVSYAQARLIDAETLEVVKIVTYCYQPGEDMASVSKQMADVFRHGNSGGILTQ